MLAIQGLLYEGLLQEVAKPGISLECPGQTYIMEKPNIYTVVFQLLVVIQIKIAPFRKS